MRKIKYRCEDSGFECNSLLALRAHVEFFNSKNHRNDYDGEFVIRYVRRNGSWELDDKFLRRIAVINGRARFQNIAYRWNRLAWDIILAKP